MIQKAVQKLVAGQSLSREEMVQAMEQVTSGSATPAQMGAFLTALRMKGETVEEIAGAALVMRARVDGIRVKANVFVDTCGTGGDGQNTFNISTAAAFVVAGAGIAVAKHGNRSISSRCGSADVLTALGVNLEIEKQHVEDCVAQVGIGFLFAPRHHPAFKAVAPVRQELGIRTLFNLLGPLANPAGARHQVMGVFESKWVPVLGRVLQALGTEHALVVHGDGLDEISISGLTQMCEVTSTSVKDYSLEPEELGISRQPLSVLAGGDAAHNARILRDVLSGQKGGPRDAVLVNAAAGLVVGKRAAALREGVALAADVIDRGAAREKLQQLVRFTSVA